jgi:hypothetical protein
MRLLWRLEATTSPAPATTRAWEARRPPVLLYHYSATRPLGSPPLWWLPALLRATRGSGLPPLPSTCCSMATDAVTLPLATVRRPVRVYDAATMSCSYVLAGHTEIVVWLDTRVS